MLLFTCEFAPLLLYFSIEGDTSLGDVASVSCNLRFLDAFSLSWIADLCGSDDAEEPASLPVPDWCCTPGIPICSSNFRILKFRISFSVCESWAFRERSFILPVLSLDAWPCAASSIRVTICATFRSNWDQSWEIASKYCSWGGTTASFASKSRLSINSLACREMVENCTEH